MEFRLLGPIEVLGDGGPIDLGPRKQRALLALLLLNPNRVVSSDRILEALWGEDAATRENALWVAVSRLRSALEPTRESHGESTILLTQEPGYVLQIDADAIDAVVFEGAVASSREILQTDPARVVTVLSDAQALWNGSPLEEFRHEEFAQVDVSRLEELHLEAFELQAAAELKLGNAREQVAQLESLHREHPLRESFVELLMRSLYQTGRHAEALRLFDSFRRSLGEEVGLDVSPELRRLEEQVLLHDSSLAPGVELVAPREVESNPFKGLRAFHEDDAESFFGRDGSVAELLAVLATDTTLVGAVGPSGSGKSSLVRAGVVPALRKGAIDGSEHWLIAQMVPGAHPFAEVEAALRRATLDAPDGFTEQLNHDDAGVLRSCLGLLPDETSKLVLVIDQFEELFTLVSVEVRTRFIANLLTAAEDPRCRIKILLTLRADFYDRPLEYPEFGRRLATGTVTVTAMARSGLEQAASEPARRAGVSLEPALLAELLVDAGDRAGALPLFQYVLTDLYDHREGDVLRLADYRSMGSLEGALARRADAVYQELDPAQRTSARQLFLRLVTAADQDEQGRRRVEAAEIISLHTNVLVMQAVIEGFGRHRLLTFDADPTTGAPTVEVAHETLLEAWPQLALWMEQHGEDVQRLTSLRALVREWDQSDRDGDYLIAGARLGEFEAWRSRGNTLLTAEEGEFLDASVQAMLADEEAEERGRQGEVRRLRILVAVIGAVLIIAVVAGLLALIQRNEAQDAAEEAELATLISRSAASTDTDPELSLLLALEAHRRSPGSATEQAVLSGLGAARTTNRVSSPTPLPGECVGFTAFFRQDQGMNEFDTIDGRIVSRDPVTEEMTDHGEAPSPCAVGYRNEAAGLGMATADAGSRHWVGPNWETILEFEGVALPLWITPTRYAVVLEGLETPQPVAIFDTATGEMVGESIEGEILRSMTASPDGSFFVFSFANPVAPEGDGLLVVIDAETGAEQVRLITGDAAEAVTVDAATGEVVAAYLGGRIITLDPEDGRVVADIETDVPTGFLDIGARDDGLLLAVSRGSIDLIDRRTGLTGTSAELGNVFEAHVRPDDAVLILDESENIQVLSLAENALIESEWPVDARAHVAFNNGRAAALNPVTQRVELVDLATGNRELTTVAGPDVLLVYPEAEGMWSISLDHTAVRTRVGQVVEELYMGSEPAVVGVRDGLTVAGTRLGDFFAVLGERSNGTGEAALVSLKPGSAQVLWSTPISGAIAAAPTPDGGMYVIRSIGIVNVYDSSGVLLREIDTGEPVRFAGPWNNEATGELYRTFFGSFVVAVDSTTGRLALGLDSGGIVIVDGTNGNVVVLPVAARVASLGFASGGAFLTAVLVDGTVTLWDLERETLAGRVWDGTGALEHEPGWFDETATAMWVSTSGKLIEIPLRPVEWVAKACVLVDRELTQSEWERFVPGDSEPQPACSS
ncbi:MAG: BTAD domain-containing putative transcriptional regulator [Acidimicrobiales bacterium]